MVRNDGDRGRAASNEKVDEIQQGQNFLYKSRKAILNVFGL